MEKYCRSGQATWRMRIACLIPKATDIHSYYSIVIAFSQQNVNANAPHCFITRTLLFLSLHIPAATSRSSNLTGHFPSSNSNNHYLQNKGVIILSNINFGLSDPTKGQIVCSVPSVNNYRCILRNISEDRMPQPHRGGRLHISGRLY